MKFSYMKVSLEAQIKYLLSQINSNYNLATKNNLKHNPGWKYATNVNITEEEFSEG